MYIYNEIALVKNWALLVAYNAYIKTKQFLHERWELRWLWGKILTYVKSASFWSYLEASHVSSHTEELRYNETVFSEW